MRLHVLWRISRAFLYKKGRQYDDFLHVCGCRGTGSLDWSGDVVRVDIVEDLLRYLKNPDVEHPPDSAAWVVATELALLTGDADCVSGLLSSLLLPLPCAERLAAHKKATPEALAVFLCRPDLPPEVLLGFVQGERRATVLAPVATKQGLPDAVYSLLGKSASVSVQSQLIANPSVPTAVKRTVFERFVQRPAVFDDHDRRVLHTVRNDPDMHQWVFDTALPCWSPDRLLEVCPQWSNLRPDQADVLLTAAEDMLRSEPSDPRVVARVELAVRAVASHPNLPDSVLDRLDVVAALHPYRNRVAAEVTAARGRPAAEQADELLRAASRSQLSAAIAAGDVYTESQILAASKNPVFDTGLACQLAAKLPSLHPVYDQCVLADRFVGAAVTTPAELVHVLMSGSGWFFEIWLSADATQRVFTGASPDELIEALTVARPQPAWRRFVELAAAAHSCSALTDEVLAHFGWSDSGLATSDTRFTRSLMELARERVWGFLLRRLGTDPAVWTAFTSIVDGSVPLGDTADLAALAADPPEHQ